jgi:hypothetical protein
VAGDADPDPELDPVSCPDCCPLVAVPGTGTEPTELLDTGTSVPIVPMVPEERVAAAGSTTEFVTVPLMPVTVLVIVPIGLPSAA